MTRDKYSIDYLKENLVQNTHPRTHYGRMGQPAVKYLILIYLSL